MLQLSQFPAICLLLIALTACPVQAAAESDSRPQVVVSIMPLYALVAGVMQDVAEPTLLLENSQSAHHASLRPSQMRALSQADLVFWIGPQLENFLPRVLNSLSSNTTSVALLANPALHTLPLRGLQHQDSAHKNESAIDPHIWLSSRNVEIMLTQITQKLIAIDPSHIDIYQRNHRRMQQEMSTLRAQLENTIRRGSYISYHDGYQYFEAEFGLRHAGSVSLNEEIQPSAGHVRALRQLIQQQKIMCLVYDAPLRPALIDTLLHDSSARAVELDGLGLRQQTTARSWFTLMHTLASDFSQCISPHNSAK